MQQAFFSVQQNQDPHKQGAEALHRIFLNNKTETASLKTATDLQENAEDVMLKLRRSMRRAAS